VIATAVANTVLACEKSLMVLNDDIFH